VWFEVYRELFAELGRPVTESEYFGQLAGLSDEEAATLWLGAGHPAIAGVVTEGVSRFWQTAGDGSTIPQAAREALATAAALVPVSIVTTGRRAGLEAVLAVTGLEVHVAFTVTAEDVSRTKPDPEGYLLALERLGDGIEAAEVLVFEDTPLGVAAAKAAGMRCVAVLGSAPRERLAAADEIVDVLDAETVARLVER
jgi:beta-phosphoglucomutase-like phosphatase (HAD superfamily)